MADDSVLRTFFPEPTCFSVGITIVLLVITTTLLYYFSNSSLPPSSSRQQSYHSNRSEPPLPPLTSGISSPTVDPGITTPIPHGPPSPPHLSSSPLPSSSLQSPPIS